MAEPVDASRPEDTQTHQTYFEAIERAFIRLRGAPFLLTTADYHLTREWHQKGIPLEIVERALADVAARRQAKEKADKLWGLRQCKRSVEAAWKARLDLEAPVKSADASSFDVPGRLARLALALPSNLEGRKALAERIEALEGEPEAVEKELEKLDAELLTLAERGLTESARRQLDGDLRDALAALAERMTSDDLARAEERLRQQLLRQRESLPVLSLFAPEAEDP